MKPVARTPMLFTAVFFNLFLRSSIFTAAVSSSAKYGSESLPVVDLGYVKQQATRYNSTGDYYVFMNIRYAAPPLGDLRFRRPQPPLQEDSIVDGTKYNDSACHQFLPPILSGIVPGVPEEGIELGSEDCLFIDVWVPRSVFEKHNGTAPVLGWWHGGGYAIGSKDAYGVYIPDGFFKTASEPFVYVAANYRLGAFGWLAPQNGDITPNIGLYDVRAAMNWVVENIGKFGGDATKFTALGESAGATVITNTLTAYGGAKEPPPFTQAYVQSPAWSVEGPSRQGRDNLYNFFKSNVNCTTIECLREASTSTLKAANKFFDDIMLSGGNMSQYGVLAPLVDDDYMPDYTPNLLTQGRLHKVKSVISSNTRYEGRLFVRNGTTLEDVLQTNCPDASNATVSKLRELYPSDGTSDADYNRAVDFETDFLAACNARWLAEAHSSKPANGTSGESLAYRYIFNIPPAAHGDDVLVTFSSVDTAINVAQRKAVTDYVLTGVPSDSWPEYGETMEAIWLNETGFGTAFDPWATYADERCHFFLEREQYA